MKFLDVPSICRRWTAPDVTLRISFDADNRFGWNVDNLTSKPACPFKAAFVVRRPTKNGARNSAGTGPESHRSGVSARCFASQGSRLPADTPDHRPIGSPRPPCMADACRRVFLAIVPATRTVKNIRNR